MAFQGSLKELPLPDIIQLVSVSGKTGVFVLKTADLSGEIYLCDGDIVHAVTGEVNGEEAVYELAIWQEGDFVFKPGVETATRTIKKSNTNLLMEAARRIDEWQVLSKRIPSTRLVPIFTNQSSSTSISFTPNEWAVICKIDERRSIDELASAPTRSWGCTPAGGHRARRRAYRKSGASTRRLARRPACEVSIRHAFSEEPQYGSPSKM